MVKLFAIQQGTEIETLLDTMADENISIELAIDDVQSTEGKNTGYSKDFQLPATKINNRFFEHYYNTDRYTTNFNPYKRVSCRIEVDGINVLTGFFTLISVDKKGLDYYYKIVAYDKVANLFDILGESTINDLTFGDVQHLKYADIGGGNSIDNITTSWTTGIAPDNFTSGAGYAATALPTDAVMYNIVGNSELYDPFNVAQNINLHGIEMVNTPICLKLKYVINKIFDFAGFEYDSNFFDDASYFEKIYFDCTTQPSFYQDTGIANANDEYVKVSVDPIDDFSAGGYPVAISTYGFTTQDYQHTQEDTNSSFDLANETYTASFYGSLAIVHYLRLENNSNFYRNIYMYAEVAGSTTMADGDYLIDTYNIAPNSNPIVTMFGDIVVSQNTTVKIKFQASGNQCQFINTGSNGFIRNPFNQLRLQLQPLDSPDGMIRNRIGNIKLVDILRDTFKMFNLVAEPTAVENKLKIEPYMNFTSTGTTVDWTFKVDMKDAIIAPIKIPRDINLLFAEDSDDYYLNRYNTVTGSDYGNFSLQLESENVSTLDIQLEVFAPAYVQEYEGTLDVGYMMHVGTEEDGFIKGYENKPRVFFKNSVVNDFPVTAPYDNVLVIGDTPTQLNHSLSQWSSGYHYANDVINTVTNTDTLTFGIVNPLFTPDIGSTPINTLYNKWYEAYFAERYNTTDSLLYTVKLKLNAQDIFNFSFANSVRIDDQLYRVNKIKYNTDKNKFSTVELYRL